MLFQIPDHIDPNQIACFIEAEAPPLELLKEYRSLAETNYQDYQKHLTKFGEIKRHFSGTFSKHQRDLKFLEYCRKFEEKNPLPHLEDFLENKGLKIVKIQIVDY